MMPAFAGHLIAERRSVARDNRAAEVEAIVDAGLHGVLVIVEAAERHQRGRGQKAAVAEIVILVLGLGRPVRREHVFEAGADGVAVAVAVDRARRPTGTPPSRSASRCCRSRRSRPSRRAAPDPRCSRRGR